METKFLEEMGNYGAHWYVVIIMFRSGPVCKDTQHRFNYITITNKDI